MPITRQVVDQIRNHIASGTLLPGDKLPSVRQLAKELAVNQNTVLRVYERLTADELLERRQGDGTYVSATLPRGRAKAQRELLVAEMDRVAHHAADLAVGADETHQLLDESWARIEKERAAAGERSEKKGRQP